MVLEVVVVVVVEKLRDDDHDGGRERVVGRRTEDASGGAPAGRRTLGEIRNRPCDIVGASLKDPRGRRRPNPGFFGALFEDILKLPPGPLCASAHEALDENGTKSSAASRASSAPSTLAETEIERDDSWSLFDHVESRWSIPFRGLADDRRLGLLEESPSFGTTMVLPRPTRARTESKAWTTLSAAAADAFKNLSAVLSKMVRFWRRRFPSAPDAEGRPSARPPAQCKAHKAARRFVWSACARAYLAPGLSAIETTREDGSDFRGAGTRMTSLSRKETPSSARPNRARCRLGIP